MLVPPHRYHHRRLLSAQVVLFLLLLLLPDTNAMFLAHPHFLATVERAKRCVMEYPAGPLTWTHPNLDGTLTYFTRCLRTIAGEVRANDQPDREKESRTRAQRKIDSQLLYAIYQMRGQARKKGTPTAEIRLRKDEKGRVLVDVRAQVTEKLVSRITKLGGAVVSRSESYHSILAYLPLGKLETLAKYREVVFIGPASESVTH